MGNIEHYKPPNFSQEDIRKSADDIRLKFWGDRLPTDVELIAERDLDILLTPLPGIRQINKTDAILLINREIVYDTDVIPFRIRFSIAHEIGHLILHTDFLNKFGIASIKDYAAFTSKIPEYIWDKIETQANEFAGRILVPKENLIKEIKMMSDKIEEARAIINFDIHTLNTIVSRVLHKKFEVSEGVIKIRLEREKIDAFEIIKEL